jgi:hypothetical protein
MTAMAKTFAINKYINMQQTVIPCGCMHRTSIVTF